MHLLWAVPIAAVVQYWAAVLARFSWCGIYGCGASGVYADSDHWLAVVSVLTSTLLVTGMLILAPWTRQLTHMRLRVIGPIAISIGLAIVMLTWVSIAF